MNEIKFLIYTMKKNIKNSAELKASFLTNVIGMMINNLGAVFLWSYLAYSIGDINGWNQYDIIALIGYVNLIFGISFVFIDGVTKLPEMIASGNLDRFLLYPKNIIIRIMTSSIRISAIGDFIFGIISLTIYFILNKFGWNEFLIILLVICLSIIIFVSVSLTISSLGFVFVNNTDFLTGAFFDLFMTPAFFHGGLYSGFLKLFFSIFIPSLLIGTVPIEVIKELNYLKLILLSLAAFFWFFFSTRLFYFLLKKYESSNYVNF